MAKVVEEFPRRIDGCKYPWGEWLDGRVWCLTRGKDFDVSLPSLQTQAFTRAKRCGLKVKTRTIGDAIYIQAIRKTD